MQESLLLVDDDVVFCDVLSRAFTRRGIRTLVTHDVAEAENCARAEELKMAVVDLRLNQQSGLALVPKLLERNPEMRVVVLTGYASIATAVEAIKLGAVQYLTKPADADEILAAFAGESQKPGAIPPQQPTPLQRLEWEHIQKVLNDCDGNVSAAARRLGLHRRTLQRKLQKRPAGLY
jgi:two-component system response regulator RegA